MYQMFQERVMFSPSPIVNAATSGSAMPPLSPPGFHQDLADKFHDSVDTNGSGEISLQDHPV